MTLQRITIDPEICRGKPCIRGLRFPVSRLLGLLAAGETPESILRSYPYLEQQDIHKALHYAAFLADEQVLVTIREEKIELRPISRDIAQWHGALKEAGEIFSPQEVREHVRQAIAQEVIRKARGT